MIITAGGPLPRELRVHSSSAVKALLPVGGATLLEDDTGSPKGIADFEYAGPVNYQRALQGW